MLFGCEDGHNFLLLIFFVPSALKMDDTSSLAVILYLKPLIKHFVCAHLADFDFCLADQFIIFECFLIKNLDSHGVINLLDF